MSLLTTVIDDKSPLIFYDSTWLPGTSQDDTYAVDYYLGTFQKNSAADGTATFSFNGTAFWIYGANRPNHGTYTVQVDSANHPGFNGSGNNLFQQNLFSTNVSQGMHIVNLINTGGTTGLYVDIDMIVWQSEVGSPGDELVPEIAQDVDPRFQYQEPAWVTASSSSNLNLNLFNNGTGHVTESSDASVSFTFIGMLVVPYISRFKLTVLTGEAVTLFGTSGPSNGPYSVQLDGGQSVTYNASNAYPTNYGVTIYHADSLGPGTHQIILTNLPSASGQYLTIDYAQLWTIANSTSGSTSPSTTPTSNIVSQNKLSSGAIAGLVVEAVVAALATAAAFFFYRRWKDALNNPHVIYTPLHRSPETTTATATGIAPSLQTRSDPSSPQNNTFQPLVPNRRSSQQLDNIGSVQDNVSSHVPHSSGDSSFVAEGVSPPGRLPIATRRRNHPDAPGGGLSQHAGASNELPPPNYDAAMRSTRV